MLGSRGGPRDSAVVSHERDLFRAGVAVKRSFHEGRRRGREEKRGRGGGADRFCSTEVGGCFVVLLFFWVFFQSAICICSFVFLTRTGRSFLSPPPPPTAAKHLKYLTGFALFLGLCSVCGGAYVMEFQLTLLCSKHRAAGPAMSAAMLCGHCQQRRKQGFLHHLCFQWLNCWVFFFVCFF